MWNAARLFTAENHLAMSRRHSGSSALSSGSACESVYPVKMRKFSTQERGSNEELRNWCEGTSILAIKSSKYSPSPYNSSVLKAGRTERVSRRGGWSSKSESDSG